MRPPSGQNLKALGPDFHGQGEERPGERTQRLG